MRRLRSPLSEDLNVYTRIELFPLSSGPAGGHQGSSPCKLKKQACYWWASASTDSHIPSPNTYIVCLSGGQEKFMCLLTLSHCLLITLQCLDNVQNHRHLYKREWPWITSGMFAGIRKVRLSLGAIWIHTSWVCGSGDGTAEGFGFTGGIGGFGFMILESRCSHFKQEKMAGPIKHVNPNITFFFVIYRFCCKWWQRSGWR